MQRSLFFSGPHTTETRASVNKGGMERIWPSEGVCVRGHAISLSFSLTHTHTHMLPGLCFRKTMFMNYSQIFSRFGDRVSSLS